MKLISGIDMPLFFRRKAQTMMEYLLMMVVVVAIVFLAFANSQNSVIARTQNKTAEYFDTGARAIMGGYFDGTKFVRVEPAAVNGGWCAWTVAVNGCQVRECACPRPAFGGAACEGEALMGEGCGSVGVPCQAGTGCTDPLFVDCGDPLGNDDCGDPCPGVVGKMCTGSNEVCTFIHPFWTCVASSSGG